jgi:predicted MFS family arabinose efflux permease
VLGIVTPVSQDLGLSAAAVSLLTTAYSLSYAVATPVLVALTGGLRRRTVLVLGLALMALGALIAAFSPVYPLMLVGRILAAIGAGLYQPNAAAVIIAVTPTAGRGRALSLLFLGMSVAQVIGVPIAAWVAYTFSWRASFDVAAIVALIALIGVARFVPREIPFRPTSLGALAAALGDKVVMVGVLVTTSVALVFGTVFPFMAPLLELRIGAGRDLLAILFALVGIGAVVAGLVMGRFLDRTGPTVTMAALILLNCLLFPALAMLPYDVWGAAALMFGLGIANFTFMPGQQARLAPLAPQMQNVVLALNASANYLGTAIAALIGGLAIDWLGYAALGPVSAAAGLFAFAHLLYSERLVRRRLQPR